MNSPPPDQARSRSAAQPARYVKLLIGDRETKSAVAGMAGLFVAALLLARSASPAPTHHETEQRLLSTQASAATPARVGQVTLSPAPQPSLLTVSAPPTRAAPFFYKGEDSDRERAVNCLAAAAWYEAGNDPEGQKSVMQVVLNRVRHPSFPKSVCGVVLQGSELSTGCQFTFTCDGSLKRRFPSDKAWAAARGLSEKALDGAVDTTVGQATHYHANYVVPWWSSALERVSQIGAHIFYRWPGGRGRLVGSRNWGTETQALTNAGLQKAEGAAGEPGMPGAPAANLAAAAAIPVVSPAISQAHLIGIDLQSPTGRWAVGALDRCVGQAGCSVIGYAKGAELDRNRNLEPRQMDRPLFLFVRDSASGMGLALWDCDRAPRPQGSQCLPKDRQAVVHLMRNR